MLPRKNLGHPGADAMAHVPRNGGARERAPALARQLDCDARGQHVKPKALQPAAPSKDLPPLRPAGPMSKSQPNLVGGPVTATSLNVVDEGSEFQQAGLFVLGEETSQLLRRLYLSSVLGAALPCPHVESSSSLARPTWGRP